MNKEMAGTIARAVLKIGGSALATWGVNDAEQLAEFIGALSVVVGFVWGAIRAHKSNTQTKGKTE